jgi:hypothetical protein
MTLVRTKLLFTDTQHNITQHNMSVFTFVLHRYVECHYAQCHGAISEHTKGYININEIIVGENTLQLLQIF